MTEELDRIRVRAYGRPPGQSISVPKVEMPTLPAEFTETVLGTPLWIAHPGSIGQYRAPPALHAYELDDHWKVHRDRYEPEEDPLGHLLFDAPEIAIAGAAAVFAGISMFCWLDEREREKDESDRNPWLPVLAALGVAAIVGIVVYFLAALLRVSFGVG
ncbi:MAG: hypothetical protein ABSB90_03895 [Thermoplasmata archaeon]|jgi:hypothetical protein